MITGFGNNSEVKVSLDNMALLRQLLDLEKTWAIMPATIGKKLSQEGECRIVALENGPEYRTCYAIMRDPAECSSSGDGFPAGTS